MPRLVYPIMILNILSANYILSTSRDDWNSAVANELHSVKPVLGNWQSTYRRCRKNETILCFPRIGHIHPTHLYKLRKDPLLSASTVNVF